MSRPVYRQRGRGGARRPAPPRDPATPGRCRTQGHFTFTTQTERPARRTHQHTRDHARTLLPTPRLVESPPPLPPPTTTTFFPRQVCAPRARARPPLPKAGKLLCAGRMRAPRPVRLCSPAGCTHFSLAWLSDGTLLLLLPLPYMPAESSDCHAPVNPSQPPQEQPSHHGDAATHTRYWLAARSDTPPVP